MKRKHLLLVTFLLSQTASVWAMDPPQEDPHPSTPAVLRTNQDPLNEVKQLQQSLLDIQRALKAHSLPHQDSVTLLLLGLTGSGKSTLMNAFAGKTLNVNASGKLDTDDPLEGSKISHKKSSETTRAVFWVGPDGTIFCDLPGRNDSRGPKQTLLNTCTNHMVSSRKCKFLLAVTEDSLSGRSREVIDLINHLTKTIDVNSLKKALLMVVTKQGSIRFSQPYQELQNILEESSLSDEGKQLLAHLTEENHIHFRIPFFPFPNAVNGPYDAPESIQNILKSIHSLDAADNPSINLQLSPDSMVYLMNLTKSVNEEVENSLHQLKPKMIDWCRDQSLMWITPDSLEELKGKMMNLKGVLEGLSKDAFALMGFWAPLDSFFAPGPNLASDFVDMLTFLKTLSPQATSTTPAWAKALGATLEEMDKVLEERANHLGDFITANIKDKIHPLVTDRCAKILDQAADEEKIIDALSAVLTILKTALDTLPYDEDEKMQEFVHSFDPLFDSPHSNIFRLPMNALTLFKSINGKITYSGGPWSEALQPSVTITNSLIEDRTRLLQEAKLKAAQEEAARIERERAEEERRALEVAACIERERAETERRALEEAVRQQQAAEIARLRDEAIAAEHRRLAELEAQRLAAEQRAIEEAARRAEDQRVYEIEKKRLEDEAKAYLVQLDIKVATEDELRRKAEADRLALAAAEDARQRAAAAAWQVEADRLAVAAAALAAEEARQRAALAVQELAAQQARQANIQRLLSLNSFTKITKEEYDLLPEQNRRKRVRKGQPVYYKFGAPGK